MTDYLIFFDSPATVAAEAGNALEGERVCVRAEIFPSNLVALVGSVGLYTKRSLSRARSLLPGSTRESGSVHAGFNLYYGNDKLTRHSLAGRASRRRKLCKTAWQR